MRIQAESCEAPRWALPTRAAWLGVVRTCSKTARAHSPHRPQPVATPVQNWSSSKLSQAAASRWRSRSEIRRQTQTIMWQHDFDAAIRCGACTINRNDSHYKG